MELIVSRMTASDNQSTRRPAHYLFTKTEAERRGSTDFVNENYNILQRMWRDL